MLELRRWADWFSVLLPMRTYDDWGSGGRQSMTGQDIDINDLRPDLRRFYKADGFLTVDHPLLRTNSKNATKINELYEQRLTLASQYFREKKWLDLLNLFATIRMSVGKKSLTSIRHQNCTSRHTNICIRSRC